MGLGSLIVLEKVTERQNLGSSNQFPQLKQLLCTQISQKLCKTLLLLSWNCHFIISLSYLGLKDE